jgi:hypothetical protein
MRAVDELLEDNGLLSAVYDAQEQRHLQSRTRGRRQARGLNGPATCLSDC